MAEVNMPKPKMAQCRTLTVLMKELFHLFLKTHLSHGKVFLGLLEYGFELRHNYIGTLSEAPHTVPHKMLTYTVFKDFLHLVPILV